MIIRIPQPDTEFRLTLVRVNDPHLEGERDATPEDLGRAGYVPLAAFVGPLDLLSPPTLAGALEAIAHLRADLRDAVNERDDLRHHYDAAGPEHNLLALLDSYESDADTARAQASAAYAMVVAAIGSVGAETIEAAVARLVAERGALVARAVVARLTAPSEGEPTDYHLFCIGRNEPRATDQELFDLGERVRLDTPADPAMSNPEEGLRCAAYLAVAERVRRERCLVTLGEP